MRDTVYDEDVNHPIKNVATVDHYLTTEEGSSYYNLILSEPMDADDRTKKRLLKKIENYLEDRASDEMVERLGRPDPSKNHLIVGVHWASNPDIVVLLEEARKWIRVNGFDLRIVKIDREGKQIQC